MIKRPLCLVCMLILMIQVILQGGFQENDLEFSSLEHNIEDGSFVEIRGTVSRREEKTEYQTLYLTDVQICYNERILEESKILVYIEQNNTKSKLNIENIAVGNKIFVEGEISFFDSATNPGNFDQKLYYQKQNIHGCVWAENVKVTNQEEYFIREWLAEFRADWKHLLIDELGEEDGNSMSAVLLGDKNGLDADLKELYQKSGIGHILAISGLHMSFIGIGFYNLLRKVGVGFLPAGIVGVLFLSLYTLMIGSGVSSIRALIMFLIRIGADVTGRVYDLPTSLSVAAAIIVLAQPLYLYDAGFLLSFGAILGIAVIEPVLSEFHILPQFLCGGMAIQLVTFPIILYFYFETPLYSQLLNLLIIPLMSVLLGAGILGSCVCLFWRSAGSLILKICSFILWLYEKTSELSMNFPYSRIVAGKPPFWMTVLYYVILFSVTFILWKILKIRKRNENKKKEKEFLVKRAVKTTITSLATAGFLAIFCIAVMNSHGQDGELKITMLDVGQGDGIYIRTVSGKHWFIDGGSSDLSQLGKYRIEPFLESQGVAELDYVFLSHGDTDHTSGITEMLQNQKLGIKIKTLVLPTEAVIDDALLEIAGIAEANGTRIVVMNAGEKITDGEMILTCLSPSSTYDGEIGNASSMVLDLKYKEFDMLFTGDLELEGEEKAISNGLLRDYDVLKVGHHGSKNATSEVFLEIVKPEIAMISAGKDNSYGHPAEETLERLGYVGCKVYTTQENGAVTVVTDGKKLWIDTYL